VSRFGFFGPTRFHSIQLKTPSRVPAKGTSLKPTLTLALAGNPNSGKTTLFNALTGENLRTGNYAGVTVDLHRAGCSHKGRHLEVVDLPGTYNLTAYSLEERVVRHYLLENHPDVVAAVVDSSNLERNLYLPVQLMELGVPLVLVFNMSDRAKAMGLEFDLERLSQLLGAPIVKTVGYKAEGVDELLEAVLKVADRSEAPPRIRIPYGPDLDEEIARIQSLIEQTRVPLPAGVESRWAAIKLLENDEELRQSVPDATILAELEKSTARIQALTGDQPEIALADRRYGFISGACQESVRLTVENRHDMSDKIDSLLLSRALGLPIFFLNMYVVFYLTFKVGTLPMDWIEAGFGWLSETISNFWPKGSENALRALLSDGVIGGVGGVVIFMPNILILFLALAFLEDSGYMARAAFLMDNLMHRIGLHGKSFIPMLTGFGCSVPAILATRTLESRRDRLTTMMVIPLMSCGARLPIYSLIIPAFFPSQWQAPALWLIYIIGILLAILCIRLLRNTLLKGESLPFVMELPPYRIPTLKSLGRHAWFRGWLYVRKAGTIILAISIVLWALTSYPRNRAAESDSESQAQSNRTEYLASVQDLNSLLGLSPESSLLREAIQAELEKEAIQEQHYESEPAYQAAHDAFRQRIESLETGPDGAALKRFLSAVEIVSETDATRLAFEEETAAENRNPFERSQPFETEETLKGNDAQAWQAATRFVRDLTISFREKEEDRALTLRAEQMRSSLAGRIGSGLEVVLKPLGFDWRIATALIGAFAAKEVFVAQLGIVFSLGDADAESEKLRERLRAEYSPLVGFCIMLFCLIGMPCVATVSATRIESGSWKWAALQMGGLTVLAWIVTALVYQAGYWLGIGL